MKPIRFAQANDLLFAAPGTEDTVQDLPICRFQFSDGSPGVTSCWEMGWWERLKAFWTGRVYITAVARTHPPIFIHTLLPAGIPPHPGPLPENPRRAAQNAQESKLLPQVELPWNGDVLFNGGPMDGHAEKDLSVTKRIIYTFVAEPDVAEYRIAGLNEDGWLVFQHHRTYNRMLLPDSVKAIFPDEFPCKIPPAGWKCSRGEGHTGPCAATPIESEGEEDRDGD